MTSSTWFYAFDCVEKRRVCQIEFAKAEDGMQRKLSPTSGVLTLRRSNPLLELAQGIDVGV
ncbi:MAG: hypothetical protein H6822_12615 [Planctomycetaceae bacterium]|nr:hypothetical protein [Planctomycetales bacterium]MCB9923019.1 hypothetical protein [Planctomycetaceae bacterium]